MAKKINDEIFSIIKKETERQRDYLIMIPSENYTSPAVRSVLGSVFTDKYSEGYPGKRYYQGNPQVDAMETLTIERAKKLFKVPFANVQPYSGSPANLAILTAVCKLKDPILSQHLYMGGHLSMGQDASFTSKCFTAYHYGLTKEGDINWQELKELAKKYRPKIIFCGGTAFTKIFDFKKYGEIADSVGAYLVADISHIAGLIAGGSHPSPKNYAHIIMTTTHKTLRGPRGAMIMVTDKGLKKDPELGEKINKAVFPGLQGGPHNNNIAALGVALTEAGKPSFKKYAGQIVKNSEALAKELKRFGFVLVGGGSENHMLWIDLTNRGIDGWTAAWGCEAAGIVVNRQTIPYEPKSPFYPSGLRLGTPALTTRGMKEKEMIKIASWLDRIIEYLRKMNLNGIGSPDKATDQSARKAFKVSVLDEPKLIKIKREVIQLSRKFPLTF